MYLYYFRFPSETLLRLVN